MARFDPEAMWKMKTSLEVPFGFKHGKLGNPM
jgi:hypothetical protein